MRQCMAPPGSIRVTTTLTRAIVPRGESRAKTGAPPLGAFRTFSGQPWPSPASSSWPADSQSRSRIGVPTGLAGSGKATSPCRRSAISLGWRGGDHVIPHLVLVLMVQLLPPSSQCRGSWVAAGTRASDAPRRAGAGWACRCFLSEGPQRSLGSRPARRAVAVGDAEQPWGWRGGPVPLRGASPGPGAAASLG
jgi:hypothetical protein